MVCRVNLDMGLCFGVNSELLRFLVKDTRLNGLFKIIYGISWKRFERFRSPCMQFESCWQRTSHCLRRGLFHEVNISRGKHFACEVGESDWNRIGGTQLKPVGSPDSYDKMTYNRFCESLAQNFISLNWRLTPPKFTCAVQFHWSCKIVCQIFS